MRSIGLVLASVLAFAATAALVRPLVPWPAEYGLAEKMRWLDAHGDEYDLVYIGTSRVFRAFDPRAFDEECAKEGVQVRSFNLGVGGARPFELDFILRKLVERRPARLKWIFHEGGVLDPTFAHQDDNTSRVVFWHTPAQTMRVLSTIALHDMPLVQSFRLSWRHIGVAFQNLTNYAQGRALLGRRLGVNLLPSLGPPLDAETLERWEGYLAFEDSADAEDEERHAKLFADPAPYFERLEEIRQKTDDFPPVEVLNLGVLASQHEVARSIGAELIFVVPPDRGATPDRRALQAAGKIETLFDFNLPDVYPSFYTLEARYDVGHLSRAGALDFSRRLAQRFVEHVRASEKQDEH